jgi:tripartite-type tricarboxylate transporter receptor subunit TctC
MQTILKTTLVYAVWAVATATVAVAADFPQAQLKFPTKPIRLMVPSSAGTATDTLARTIGAKLSESWGQPVVVDSRPGGGGALATNIVAKAAPDGHTLLLTSGFAISAALQPNLPYDPFKDFVGAGQIAIGTAVLIVAPVLGVKSVRDLIALAKAQPGKIIFASGPTGTGIHLSGARIIRDGGIKVITVVYKGSPDAIIEVLAGRAHYSYAPMAPALSFIKEGKLLALAVTPQRLRVLPEVPTLAETLPDFKVSGVSYGLLAPAGTPRPILNKISKDVAYILDRPTSLLGCKPMQSSQHLALSRNTTRFYVGKSRAYPRRPGTWVLRPSEAAVVERTRARCADREAIFLCLTEILKNSIKSNV